jgi:hypothetical protein
MDAATLAATQATVNSIAETVGALVGTIDPQLIPIIALGKIAAAASPGLINDVEQIIASKQDPDQAANDALALKIAALANPSTL